MATKKIFFDMDGTLFDLYGRKDWLEDLRAEKPGVYVDLEPLWNMDDFNAVCDDLMAAGFQLGVITWLGMGASDEYEAITTEEKKESLRKWAPALLGDFHALRYGTPKQYAPFRRAGAMWLVDDNREVLSMWETPKQRRAIDANCDDLPAILAALAEEWSE